MTTISTTGPVPHPRSRLRARLVLAGFATVGLAALAWAAFVQPLPRMAYNPSASVAVGWYRIEPFAPRTASRPRPLSVDSIVLMPLPDRAAMLAAQRGYLPTRVPLLKRVGAVAPQHVCIVAGQVRSDGVPVAAALPAARLGRPLPSLQLCRRLQPGELFLLSATNPASFDSRYFGPVSAFAVIGVAHPIWLETRP
ncbi:S26 family signal peptidase [Achromobacter aegrifaciens]|uniref:S26 family signal peptidase n=1 Tax=Achromobacter aegrifaciens TaxID=1287736 RepID=UPI000F74578C|nr:S26 family signal peptidase [Achromobacter aegrifaciens]RSE92877.1 S26 family signal peptidase [Achromobacter aegrifaciens]